MVGVVRNTKQNTSVVVLFPPCFNVVGGSWNAVDGTPVFERLRLHHYLKKWDCKGVSVFVRDKSTVQDTETVCFVVSTWSKGIEEGREAESRGCRLGLTSEIRFSGSNNDFFLRVHSSGDTRNEVSDLRFQDRLFVVPSPYLFRLYSFLDWTLLPLQHVLRMLCGSISIFCFSSNFFLQKSLTQWSGNFLGGTIIFPRNPELIETG